MAAFCESARSLLGRLATVMRREHGMVTAEIAVGLTGLVFVLLAGLWMVSIIVGQVRCIDAARDTARAVARGESDVVARDAGRRSAPSGAQIAIGRRGGWAQVEVAYDAKPRWPVLARLPPVLVEGRATVVMESETSGEPP